MFLRTYSRWLYYAGIEYGDRHMVKNSAGQNIRPGGYRRVGRITPEIGNWLWENRDLLERAPQKINLWGMFDWGYVNDVRLAKGTEKTGATR
jgi:hypothetical protein